jgi:hypothetical protein
MSHELVPLGSVLSPTCPGLPNRRRDRGRLENQTQSFDRGEAMRDGT